MSSLKNESDQLQPLTTFDPLAFQGDQAVPQDLCNFVLSVSLLYNDLKNSLIGFRLLIENQPDSAAATALCSGAEQIQPDTGSPRHVPQIPVGLSG